MTQKISILTLSIAAAAPMAAERFIGPSGAVASAGGNAIGAACTSASAAGELIPYDALGTSVVVAGAAIANGAAIEVGVDGKAITKATGITVARAVQAATAAGDRIEVFLIPN